MPKIVPRLAVALLTLLALVATRGVARAAAEDWNDAHVKWQSYDAGLAEAKTHKRPICLIVYTTWCPHCTNYSKLFANPDVVKKTEAFVMIRLDGDKQAELSKKYQPDGSYIPRTYFLAPDGTLDPTLTAEREKFKYFYDETNPAGILAGMDRALKKLR